MISIIIYRISLWIYSFILKLISPFNTKAKLWVEGRKKQKIHPTSTKPTIWIHTASVGEFEQGLPLIQQIKSNHEVEVIVTFFSPSGYEAKKNDPNIDKAYYLPIDSPKNAKQFIDQIKPELAVFVKYEFWYYYFKELNDKSIPLYVISSNFRTNQPFFKWYGNLHRSILDNVSHFFVQTQTSKELLQSISISSSTVTGDTRLDRVTELKEQKFNHQVIELFTKNKKTIILGSVWPKDMDLFYPIINKELDINWIIAPHELHYTSQIKQKLSLAPLLSTELDTYTSTQISEAKIIIINEIGILSKIYRYAHLSYVGGGFGSGLHNILEPIVYEKPVIIGPKFSKFSEAVELVKHKAVFPINTQAQLKETIHTLLSNNVHYKDSCEVAKKYISENSGATEKIYKTIKQHLS